MFFRKILYILILISIGVIVGSLLGINNFNKTSTKTAAALASPTPTPFNPFPYKIPTVTNNKSYLTFLVGDSMVGALGVNANQLRLDLISHYPTHEFVNYNYGFGATNILTLPDRITKGSTYLGNNYQSVLSQGFDLIIIESFAYNPLSEMPVAEGLKKQTEILDQSVREIIKQRPGAVVAIMTPIAPNRQNFAKGVYNLNQTQRDQWVDERIAYINNAIEFAKVRNLPLINVYEKSKTADGNGDLKYINKKDYIHPSTEGIKLMSQTIADFIFQNNIFPN